MVGLTTGLCALEDTPENRAKLSERLIHTFPIREHWKAVEKARSDEHRRMHEAVSPHFNWHTFVKDLKQILIETYTLDEIQALIDVYSSPIGRSIQGKQGEFLSAEELRAARGFFSSPVGQSILKKQRIFNSKLMGILKKEFMKAGDKIAEKAETARQSKIDEAIEGRLALPAHARENKVFRWITDVVIAIRQLHESVFSLGEKSFVIVCRSDR